MENWNGNSGKGQGKMGRGIYKGERESINYNCSVERGKEKEELGMEKGERRTGKGTGETSRESIFSGNLSLDIFPFSKIPYAIPAASKPVPTLLLRGCRLQGCRQ